jgi:hypothetical protein
MNSSRLSVEQERTLLRSSALVERAGSGDAAQAVLTQVSRLDPLERVTCARAYARWLSSPDGLPFLGQSSLLLAMACYHWLWDEREAGRDWDPRPWWVPLFLSVPPQVSLAFVSCLVLLSVGAFAWGVLWLVDWLWGGL